jgi:predicted PurR-regulated permease PerM
MQEPARREWRLAGIIFFSLIALLVLWATFRIIWPFATPILLAAMLVTLTFNLFTRLRVRLRGSSALAAIIMLFGITFLLVIPFFIIALLLVHQATGLVQNMQSGEAQQMLARLDMTNRLQWLHHYLPGFDPQSLSPQRLVLPIVRGIPGWVARNGTAVVGGAAGLVIGFLLTLLATYFFYVEGEAIMRELAILSPLPSRYDREFAVQFKDVVDATFRGHMMTGLAQGIATMIGLLIAKVPAALFWGSVATVISLLPFIGAATIWVPAAIYLYVSAAMGHAAYWQAIFLTIWGIAGISTIDNVIRPWAMKGKTQLPAIPLLFSVLGGMEAFGVIGLVIGPLVFSLFMTIIDIYKRTFQLPRSESDVA